MGARAADRWLASLLLLPSLPQQELGVSWRRRLRWVKVAAVLLLLLLPAIVSFLHSQFVEFGLGRVAALIGLGVSPMLMASLLVNGRRELKDRRETRRDHDAARIIQQLILPRRCRRAAASAWRRRAAPTAK
jgi:hypothetical protein